MDEPDRPDQPARNLGRRLKLRWQSWQSSSCLHVQVYVVNIEIHRKLVKMTEPIFATERRVPLTKERVLRAAVDLADREGIEARACAGSAKELGVEAMALYRHVPKKPTTLLQGLGRKWSFVVAGEIEQPYPSADWKDAMRTLVMSSRRADAAAIRGRRG